jgi:hypothetical protein
MATNILIDEFHLTIQAPRGLPEAEYQAMRRALDDRRFQTKLRAAVRNVARQHQALRKTRFVLSR